MWESLSRDFKSCPHSLVVVAGGVSGKDYSRRTCPPSRPPSEGPGPLPTQPMAHAALILPVLSTLTGKQGTLSPIFTSHRLVLAAQHTSGQCVQTILQEASLRKNGQFMEHSWKAASRYGMAERKESPNLRRTTLPGTRREPHQVSPGPTYQGAAQGHLPMSRQLRGSTVQHPLPGCQPQWESRKNDSTLAREEEQPSP